MDPQHAFAALQSLIALVGVLFLWQVLWPRLVIDAARQRFFAIRDRLFLIALEQQGGVTFRHLGYEELRKQINSMINAAHGINGWGFLVMLPYDVLRGTFKSRSQATVVSSNPEISEAAAAVLQPIERELRIQTAKLLLLRTPLLGIVTLFVTAMAIGTYVSWRSIKAIQKGRAQSSEKIKVIVQTRVQRSIAKEVSRVVRRADEYEDIHPMNGRRSMPGYRDYGTSGSFPSSRGMTETVR